MRFILNGTNPKTNNEFRLWLDTGAQASLGRYSICSEFISKGLLMPISLKSFSGGIVRVNKYAQVELCIFNKFYSFNVFLVEDNFLPFSEFLIGSDLIGKKFNLRIEHKNNNSVVKLWNKNAPSCAGSGCSVIDRDTVVSSSTHASSNQIMSVSGSCCNNCFCSKCATTSSGQAYRA